MAALQKKITECESYDLHNNAHRLISHIYSIYKMQMVSEKLDEIILILGRLPRFDPSTAKPLANYLMMDDLVNEMLHIKVQYKLDESSFVSMLLSQFSMESKISPRNSGEFNCLTFGANSRNGACDLL